jgi:hypothetical protein
LLDPSAKASLHFALSFSPKNRLFTLYLFRGGGLVFGAGRADEFVKKPFFCQN